MRPHDLEPVAGAAPDFERGRAGIAEKADQSLADAVVTEQGVPPIVPVRDAVVVGDAPAQIRLASPSRISAAASASSPRTINSTPLANASPGRRPPPSSLRTIDSMPAACSAPWARSASCRYENVLTTTKSSAMEFTRSAKAFALHLNHVDEFFDRRRGLLEGGVLFRSELDFDDFLEAARSELAWNADEQIADTVLALQEHRTRDDLLLVEQNGLDHLHDRRAGRIPRARADQLRDLRAAARRPRGNAIDRRLVHQVGDRNPPDGRVGRQGD